MKIYNIYNTKMYSVQNIIYMYIIYKLLNFFRHNTSNIYKFFFSQKIITYILKKTHYGKQLINNKIEEAKLDMQSNFDKVETNTELVLKIPENCSDNDEIISRLTRLQENDCKWKEGKAFGYIYSGEEEHTHLLNKIYQLYVHTNPLHTSAFPSTRILEAEVVRMVSSMLGGNKQTCGCMTSGGSESIILAVKAARDMFREKNPGIKPQIICCDTVHAAFVKASKYFDIDIIITDVTSKYQCDPIEYEKYISNKTMMLVVSAPSYPYGIIDDIEPISELAERYNIWLHVDACLGGFVLPWLNDIGYEIPKFNFELNGVTSISCDTHKYGFASKGTSVILYRSPLYRKYQFFCWSEWRGGLFSSPSITGSRPGGLIAVAWASIVKFGKKGFLEATKTLMTTTENIIKKIKTIPELNIIGKPTMCVLAINSVSREHDIFIIGDLLEKNGWHLEKQQNPNSLHLTVTLKHEKYVDNFISDLKEAVNNSRGLIPSGKAAVYGNAVKISDPSLIDELLIHYAGLITDSIDKCGLFS